MFFHCHEACALREEGNNITLTRDGKVVTLGLPDGGDVRVLRGSIAPIGGWVSRAFDRKQPAPTIAWRARLSGSVALRTVIAA
jgi:hypothetical protein